MKCPTCKSKHTKVVDTIREDTPRGRNKLLPVGVVQRVRVCSGCGHRFRSFEFMDGPHTRQLVETFELLQ